MLDVSLVLSEHYLIDERVARKEENSFFFRTPGLCPLDAGDYGLSCDGNNYIRIVGKGPSLPKKIHMTFVDHVECPEHHDARHD